MIRKKSKKSKKSKKKASSSIYLKYIYKSLLEAQLIVTESFVM